MEQIEKKKQGGRLNSNYINNFINYKRQVYQFR